MLPPWFNIENNIFWIADYTGGEAVRSNVLDLQLKYASRFTLQKLDLLRINFIQYSPSTWLSQYTGILSLVVGADPCRQVDFWK